MDRMLSQIEQVRSEGAVVLLKWDGCRESEVCTVMISRPDTDYVWRKDGENMDELLFLGIQAYRAKHAGPIAS